MVGDQLAITRGCNLPFILRKHGQGYKIVEPCYVDRIMHGEALGSNPVWQEPTLL